MKKVNSGPESPFIPGKTITPNANESKYKSYFPPNVKGQATDNGNDDFLRASCSNVLRKQESDINLGKSSLRNTTKFNISNKFSGSGMTESKKLNT